MALIKRLDCYWPDDPDSAEQYYVLSTIPALEEYRYWELRRDALQHVRDAFGLGEDAERIEGPAFNAWYTLLLACGVRAALVEEYERDEDGNWQAIITPTDIVEFANSTTGEALRHAHEMAKRVNVGFFERVLGGGSDDDEEREKKE